ncbi:hypothetical protein CRENBAI_011745 [Crenichthys baileyi]|uniref:Uncharacterized protein n=1 Tax=Crenichthys baileyi TaxID=28760 RepID=A0AAV9QRL8_9TELE
MKSEIKMEPSSPHSSPLRTRQNLSTCRSTSPALLPQQAPQSTCTQQCCVPARPLSHACSFHGPLSRFYPCHTGGWRTADSPCYPYDSLSQHAEQGGPTADHPCGGAVTACSLPTVPTDGVATAAITVPLIGSDGRSEGSGECTGGKIWSGKVKLFDVLALCDCKANKLEADDVSYAAVGVGAKGDLKLSGKVQRESGSMTIWSWEVRQEGCGGEGSG